MSEYRSIAAFAVIRSSFFTARYPGQYPDYCIALVIVADLWLRSYMFYALSEGYYHWRGMTVELAVFNVARDMR